MRPEKQNEGNDVKNEKKCFPRRECWKQQKVVKPVKDYILQRLSLTTGTFGGPKFVFAQFWEVFINSSGS